MAGGDTYNTVLRVNAKASGTMGHTLTSPINIAADGVHGAVSSSVVTTIGTDTLVHNADRFGKCSVPAYSGTSAAECTAAGGTWTPTAKANSDWGLASDTTYGEFTCDTCHTRATTNIKRVKASVTSGGATPFPGSTVNFKATNSTTNGFGDDSVAHPTSQKICEVCHSATSYHKYNQLSTACHEVPNGSDCISCHKHQKGFAFGGGKCLACHSVQQGNRAPVVGQFSSNSHHVQGTTLTDAACYQCHWEAADIYGTQSSYHGGCTSPGSVVDLVTNWTTSRPTVYTGNNVQYNASLGTQAERAKISTHCLGCHDEDTKTATPFGDGKTPIAYAWDGNSIATRYNDNTSTTWGKFSGNNTAAKAVQKAYSPHGAGAGVNVLGWDTSNGVDGAITDRTGSGQVLCIDCHNSHGSSVEGTTSSYASATTNGAILKDVTSGVGGYTATYKPQSGGSVAGKNAYNAGAALCFDCHMNASSSTSRPWGYGTYGATDQILGYQSTPYFGAGFNGQQQRYTYKQSKGGVSAGGHFGASDTMVTTPTGSISGLCTPCHDPHGVTTNTTKISAANRQYAVPLLKGTWITSPYKEDAAPSATNEPRGGGSKTAAFNVGSTPGHHLDQNTFQAPVTTNLTGYEQWNFNTNASTLMTASDTQFAGLCMQCHPKADINPTTTASTWKAMDRVHNTVKGWGGAGANASNAVHAYTCSKCHAPHNSQLPRMLITNCLDWKHRGRVASGGAVQVNGPAANGTSGTGTGRYPAGGGGYSASRSGRPWRNNAGGAYFFGNPGTSRTTKPAIRTCHDVSGAGGTTFPDAELWNNRTPW